mmetsp:Transcript_22424/g.53323  ORF Transcript_22424/g.53323 Transcript_22424/m.53323 type:complete len:218 (+) Transcript_22424:667-1320(+)
MARRWYAQPSSRTLLLLRGSREQLRTCHHRFSVQGLLVRRNQHLRCERRGHAGTARIPSRTMHWNRRRGSTHDVPIHLAARVRRLPGLLHPSPQAHRRGRLERSRYAHQRFHQEHAGRGWTRGHQAGHLQARRKAPRAHRYLRGRKRASFDRKIRDRLHQRFLLRNCQPWCIHPYRTRNRNRWQGILRRSPTILQRRPIPRDRKDHVHHHGTRGTRH